MFLTACPTIKQTVQVSGRVVEYNGETTAPHYSVSENYLALSSENYIIKTQVGSPEISGYLKKLTIPGKGNYYLVPGTLDRSPAFDDGPGIERIENSIYVPCFVPNDNLYNYQWNMRLLGMESIWENFQATNHVKIAVLDTGFSMEHPDLDGIFSTSGYDFVDDDEDPTDADAITHSHGTHVTGIIGALTNNTIGVVGMDMYGAPGRIIPIRVLGKNSGNVQGTAMGIASGIMHAVDNGALVINMSLTGPDNQAVHDAIAYAYENGVTVVCAAGNYNMNVGFPARYDEAIAVGAVNKNAERAYYSNHGDALEVMAPGGDSTKEILSTSMNSQTGNDYHELYGTSMAAPHVTALVGMMINMGITGVENIRDVLHETAIDLGEEGFDTNYGFGLIDPARALGENSQLPLEVLAISESTGKIESRTTAAKTGEFSFQLKFGQAYYIVVWRDIDRNSKINRGDTLGYYGYTGGNHEDSDPETLKLTYPRDDLEILYSRLLSDNIEYFN